MIQTIQAALDAQGYTALTPVQTEVTAEALGDADLLVSAQTGSGKTVAFGLAIAPTILAGSETFSAAAAPLALIIAPTRELALQVKRELSWLYANAGARVVSCVGGMDMRDERRALAKGAHIVVATPGRLCDHIKRGSIEMSDLRAVVLDEADEMLDLGFREDLEFILGEAPETRRTLMFSATVPKSIATLSQRYLKNAQRITVASEARQHADIEYRALSVANHDAESAIINVLRYYEAENALVFCNTRAMVNRLTTRFSNRGFAVVALSGELTQSERSHALQAMRDGRAKVCAATDVAARGIDLPKLELVIHAELPSNAETLLHRSGRTGRAGRKGVSALIVTGKVRKKAERLLKTAKISAEWAVPPTADDVLSRDRDRILADPMWDTPVSDSERAFVETLTATHSADAIAAAFVRLHQQRQSAPEDLSPVDPAAKSSPRQSFGPSKWFSVSIGRAKKAEPRWLLPMLCRVGDLTKDDIGAIRIQHSESYVEIREAAVEGFLKAVGPKMDLEDGTKLTALDAAPDLDQRPSKPRHDRPKQAHRGKDERPQKKHVAKWRDAKPSQGNPIEDKPKQSKPKRHTETPPQQPKPKPEKTESKRAQKPKTTPKEQDAPRSKPKAKPNPGKPQSKSAASDTSKRFTPPGKSGKPRKPKAGSKGSDGPAPFRKPRVSKGANAVPKRGKSTR